MNKSLLSKVLPKSLLGQVTLVMFIGVVSAQVIGNYIWSWQARNTAASNAETMAVQIANAAENSIIYFKQLPPYFRDTSMQTMREMGGLRYLVMFNKHPVPVHDLDDNPLKDTFLATLDKRFNNLNSGTHDYRFWFSEPDKLVMNDKGTLLTELPDSWTQFSLLLEPKPAPVLAIQVPLEDGQWLLITTLLPDPYLLDKANIWHAELLIPQFTSLIGLLFVCLLAVSLITRPLAKLSQAAENFGKGLETEALPQATNKEMAKTTEAFNDMRERIQRYITDRERLFAAISHDLRTPITRLKLRAELLDDEEIIGQFHEDLDELDLMVKGALQSVKESDIHENRTLTEMHGFVRKIADGFNLESARVTLDGDNGHLEIKPLAMKRAISNIIDNGIKYGDYVHITLHDHEEYFEINIRDFGPGVPNTQLSQLCRPYVRLEHGKHSNEGFGLGLSISKNIIESHGGSISFSNDLSRGLIAKLIIPKALA